ncbi:GntR family transcriptional regulator [Corynebacterium pacaense]|uniref:GntR family transcriptional regulator n=1 Tax=Corynebacterium pacaense TaxID=1816684 RepID=UPI0009BC54E3|nr:GntR family transcriptional regulator [Corynebacterium pacaense]
MAATPERTRGRGDKTRRGAGRPRIQETADDIVASVIATAGPRVGSRDYSTRRISSLTGLSQTVVSRAVVNIRRAGAGGGAPDEGGRLHIVEFTVEFPEITIVLAESGDHMGTQVHASARRATAVMAALRVSGARDWKPNKPLEDSGGAAAEESTGGTRSIRWRPGGPAWDDFLDGVAVALSACTTDADSIPGDLLALLAQRADRGLHGVRWRRLHSSGRSVQGGETSEVFDSHPFPLPEYPAPGQRIPRHSPWLPQNELSITEQIAISLRKEIMNSGFQPGDRIPPSMLASDMGIQVSTVRSAMRRMTDDGLLTFGEGSFSIPEVSGRDIIDLYAARRQLGTLILRACSAQPRHSMLAPRIALRSLEAAAVHGTSVHVDQADLHFQQEIADSSGLLQTARSFHALTLRVRMFISVLRLDYRPAIDRILSDDRRILRALVSGDQEEAVRVWWAKLDNAVKHMSAKSPVAFDKGLWEQLTGGR